jgi:predicted membrane protein
MEIQESESKKPGMKPKSIVFGILILVFGFLLLFRNTGVINERIFHILFSWEMLLIAIGLINLFDRNKPLGIILIAVGGLFLLPHIVTLPFSFNHIFWPVVIIAIGLLIIFGTGKNCRRRGINQLSSDGDIIDDVAVFSGVERNITSKSFKGGKVITVFGGAKLNLNQAILSAGPNEIEIVCLFGGITFIAPADWNIKVEVMHVFGGFQDKRPPMPIDHEKNIVIKGVTIFGGGDVKSF